MPSLPASYDLLLYQGDNASFTFTIDGNYSAYEGRLDIRPTPASASIELALITPTNITLTYSGTTLKTTVAVVFPAVDTAAMSATTVYAYDFQVKLGSITRTFLYGSLTVLPEVTR
jgi:hypothetical protein